MMAETQMSFLMGTYEFKFIWREGRDKPSREVDLTGTTGSPRDAVRPRVRTVEHHYLKIITVIKSLTNHGFEPGATGDVAETSK